MNRWIAVVLSMLSLCVMTVPVLAQERGRPPREDRPEMPDRPGMPDRPDPVRPGMPGAMMRFEMMRGYIDLVDRFARLSQDPAMSGVAAVVAAADLLKQRGNDAAIDFFNKLLPDVKNQAVVRAIRIQLIDLYKQSGQTDKALEQMEVLIKGAPAEAVSQPR